MAMDIPMAGLRDATWSRLLTAWRAPVAAGDIALFGPGCAAALLAGVTGGLLLPGLPAAGWLLVVLLAGLALLLRGGGCRLAGALLFGIGFTGLHAAHVLRAQLPPTLERRALEVEGRIGELPVHEPRRTRFEFVVDDDASQPPELRGKRIRLGWFEEDMQGRVRLQAGSRDGVVHGQGPGDDDGRLEYGGSRHPTTTTLSPSVGYWQWDGLHWYFFIVGSDSGMVRDRH